MRRTIRILLALAIAISAGFPHAPALAADLGSEPVQGKRKLVGRCSTLNNLWLWGDPRDCPGDEVAPACDASHVVAAAVRFVNRAEPVSGVPDIERIENPRELHATTFNPSELVRRFCVGHAILDQGGSTRAYYFIEEDAGFVGFGWKVYVCLMGFDKWRVYDGRCRDARPVDLPLQPPL